ncbi:MAG TPA: low molecular weight phosphatase family protein [Phenylobacterium sp.]|jgi:protein-tyrosine-phosphatase|uniref:arsenate-mycothiol transferase ArsC n=1 Tax=Phenylobacterium sp. TaxID=1871053 RepID=UPI002C41F1B3|nr:low molecular weight phosphatase family protein [Phenylobacterium sp.]HXA40294.1 low molecular weight phosphatase family protein [Phenylobacterium sp.]
MPADAPPPAPGAVLFACNFNQVRSPMAEALLKRLVGKRIFVDSCGLKLPALVHDDVRDEDVEAGVDPFAQAVMAELGWDISHYRPKTFGDLEDSSFDLVVSLTPEAHHRAVELARSRAADIEYWPTHDPTLAEGSREARLEAYRQVRDALARRIAERFGGLAASPIDLAPDGAL